MSLEKREAAERAVIISRLQVAVVELRVAAIPTKSEVFTCCGRHASQLADDIEALIGERGFQIAGAISEPGVDEAFGTMMRRLREAKGLSLQGLADLTGMTKTHMWDLEQGRAANPCVSTIAALGRALDAEPTELFRALASLSNTGGDESRAGLEALVGAPAHG